jgi:hypothetical protein
MSMSPARGVAQLILTDKDFSINVNPDLEIGVSLTRGIESSIARLSQGRGSLRTIRDLAVCQAILVDQSTQCNEMSNIDTTLRCAMTEISLLADDIAEEVHDSHDQITIEVCTPIAARDRCRLRMWIAGDKIRI